MSSVGPLHQPAVPLIMTVPQDPQNNLQNLLIEYPDGYIPLQALADSIEPETSHALLFALALLTFVPIICTPAGCLSSLLFWRLLRNANFQLPAKLKGTTVFLPRILNYLAGPLRWEARLVRAIPPLLPAAMRGWPWTLCHCSYGLILTLGTLTPIPGINYLFAPALATLTLSLRSHNAGLALLAYLLPIAQFIALRAIYLAVK